MSEVIEHTAEKPLYFRCKCGEVIEGYKNTDPQCIVCPACKRTGQVEERG